MKKIITALAALALVVSARAGNNFWNGTPVPAEGTPDWVDPYFNVQDGSSLTEFDRDTGIEFSLQGNGNTPNGITEANGWFNAALYAPLLNNGDEFKVTYLGKTAGALNDFGINIGGMNAYGYGGASSTLWSQIGLSPDPELGEQYIEPSFSGADGTIVDFWLNSPDEGNDRGGTYSVFYPATSDPDPSGEPNYDYTARAKLFHVNDSFSGMDRSVLVLSIEDWRNWDTDFTDMFFAIEIPRVGLPVPEPSTYGMIGAMVLLGLVAVRRFRRSR